MRYKDLIEGKVADENLLNEDDGGGGADGATTSGDIATFTGYFGYGLPKKGKRRKAKKPVVIRRPK